MDLNEFSRQLESMHARFMQLCPTNGAERGDLRSMWEETSEALGVTVEELRVAEEELRQQNGRAGGVAADDRGGAAAVSGPVRLRAGRLPGDGPGRDDPGGEPGGRRAAGGRAALPGGQAAGQLHRAGRPGGVPGGPESPAAGGPARGLDRPGAAAAGSALSMRRSRRPWSATGTGRRRACGGCSARSRAGSRRVAAGPRDGAGG